MKSILVFSILILYPITVVIAENAKCFEQIRRQALSERLCLAKIFDETEILADFNTTVVHYSGDESQIHRLANKYCPILHQLLRCITIGDDIDPRCIYPDNYEKLQLEHQISYALLNYACANNASVVLQVLENNGLATIYRNRNFSDCVKLLSSSNKIGVNWKLCDGMDRVFECYINFVQNHNNRNLVPIANDAHALIRQELNCTSS